MAWRVSYKRNDLKRVGGRAFPGAFEVTSDSNPPWPDMRASFELAEDGAYECRSFALTAVEGGRQITRADLRAVTIEDLLETGVALVGAVVIDEPDGTVRIEPATAEGEWRETVRAARQARSRRKLKVDAAFLRETAEVYASHTGRAPVQHVADHFGKSLRTASWYVKQARQAGLLADVPSGEERP